MAGNIRNAHTTHPRRKARQLRAFNRFDTLDSRSGDTSYQLRKSEEYAALRRAVGALA